MTVSLSHNVIADDGFVIANFAKQYGISTIFLKVAGDDVGALAAQNPQTVANLNAMFDVANVYVLTGDPSWLATPTTVPSDVNTIVRTIAPLYPRFAGILYDIEPTSTQNAAYFQLLNTLFAGSQPYAFGTTILETNPRWWRQPNSSGGSSPSMLQQVESYSAVTQTYLMMNGHSAATQMTHDVAKALTQLTKPYWSGADAATMQGGSYYGSSASYLSSNLTQVAAQVSAIDSNFAGVSVSEWDDGYGALEVTFPQPSPPPVPQPTGPLVPPVGQSYLGAYVDPNHNGNPTEVAAFETQIGRKLAYDLHFLGFNKPFIGGGMTDDANNGRIPLVAWDCGDSNARVAAGADDAQIKTSAAAAAAYGHPIFLRFLWEMNLPVMQARKSCYDPATDLPNNKLSPTHFIAAWRHMHDLFVAAGATNVIWVWDPSAGGPTPGEYYPGADVVDWVGMDHYNRTSTSFASNFTPYMNSDAQYDKPIMICETGALASYQSTYFPDLVNSLTTAYPLVKAVSYFDGGGGMTPGSWILSNPGTAAFAAMGQQPYFSAVPQL